MSSVKMNGRTHRILMCILRTGLKDVGCYTRVLVHNLLEGAGGEGLCPGEAELGPTFVPEMALSLTPSYQVPFWSKQRGLV